ncbi:hypothetical protein, partial [Delftia sp. DT-2]|uniref:hypothetical protein n=1 Tax=Delftia sp. DT-2 TaxID=3022772 RepID=UPI00233F17EB
REQGPRPVLAHGPLASAALSTTTVHAWAVAMQPCKSNARASRRSGLLAGLVVNRCLYILIAIFTSPEMGRRNAFWILRNTGREIALAFCMRDVCVQYHRGGQKRSSLCR